MTRGMDTAERRATAALWSIRGVGPVTLREVQRRLGPLEELFEKPVSSWARAVPWRGAAVEAVAEVSTLAARAEWLERRCAKLAMQVVFPHQPEWPSRLSSLSDAPPLLFLNGPGARAPLRRRVAIVGTRKLDLGSRQRVHDVAREAASAGLGIVAGAAVGVDQGAHLGALAAKGETWAFMGCALDQIDTAQVRVARAIVEQGGSLFSEFPPGFRSNLNSFKLRNRLISGSADATLIFRAPLSSGAMHTAKAAQNQGRPLLATPGDPWNTRAAGCNLLIHEGAARPHLSLRDLLDAVGLKGTTTPKGPPPDFDPSTLSEGARQVYTLLGQGSSDFESLLLELPALTSGQLTSALVELEVCGAVLQKGARRYEKR